jgi:hypothetical protein
MEIIQRSNGNAKAFMIAWIFVIVPSYFFLSHLYQFDHGTWKDEFKLSYDNMTITKCKQSLLFYKRGNCKWVRAFDLLFIRTILLLHEWIHHWRSMIQICVYGIFLCARVYFMNVLSIVKWISSLLYSLYLYCHEFSYECNNNVIDMIIK